ncbi:MAG: hypothetical protein IJS91_02915 [Bacteroidales bacterium]|nr:hypothetical protein [Bacteroidales bacterium]
MTRRGEIPGQTGSNKGQTGNDKGPAGNGDNHIVTPNNIHLESSFTISKDDFESELKALREQYPDSLVWNRSIKSLKHEWAAHNAMHAMGIARRQTAHADLNWPQPWLIRLGYAIVGTIAWPFIK